MNLGPQMADISVDNQMASFNIGAYGDSPLKMKEQCNASISTNSVLINKIMIMLEMA